MDDRRRRLALFADPRDIAARILLPATLAAVGNAGELHCPVVLLPESARHAGSWADWAARLRDRLVQLARGTGRWESALRQPPLSLARLARRKGVSLVFLPDDDPNHPEIVARLNEEFRCGLSLNLYCQKRFGPELLAQFAVAANYHNGSLPRFRGLRASNWSLYQAASTSGYCFHRMDDGIDSGNLLIEGEVAVRAEDTPAQLEWRKAHAAAQRLPELLRALAENRAGRPQSGMAGEHNRHAHELATRIDDPGRLSAAEWRRRLHAFIRLHVRIDGRWLAVTGVRAARPGDPLCFRCADDQWLAVVAVDFLPVSRTRQ